MWAVLLCNALHYVAFLWKTLSILTRQRSQANTKGEKGPKQRKNLTTYHLVLLNSPTVTLAVLQIWKWRCGWRWTRRHPNTSSWQFIRRSKYQDPTYRIYSIPPVLPFLEIHPWLQQHISQEAVGHTSQTALWQLPNLTLIPPIPG